MAESSKTAVVTGGAGGLGRALTAVLVNDGWHVAAIDLPGAALEAAEGPQVSLWPCDLTDEAAVGATCTAIVDARPSIDVVIYNAGITQVGLFADLPSAAHRTIFEVNYFGSVNVAAGFVHALRASGGKHLAISSVAGFAPLYKRTAYAGSKHALEGFFGSLASEEKAHGVSVHIAAPSFVATNIGRPDEQPGGIARPGSATDGVDYMDADEAARLILRGLAKGKKMIPVGRVASMAWRLHRTSPGAYVRMMERNIAKDD